MAPWPPISAAYVCSLKSSGIGMLQYYEVGLHLDVNLTVDVHIWYLITHLVFSLHRYSPADVISSYDNNDLYVVKAIYITYEYNTV